MHIRIIKEGPLDWFRRRKAAKEAAYAAAIKAGLDKNAARRAAEEEEAALAAGEEQAQRRNNRDYEDRLHTQRADAVDAYAREQARKEAAYRASVAADEEYKNRTGVRATWESKEITKEYLKEMILEELQKMGYSR